MFDRPLKILIVLPLYGGSLPIGYYCADALKKLGHHVELFEAPEFLQAHTALRSLNISQEKLNILEQNFVQLISQAIYAQTEENKPDLVLAMAQAPINKILLKKLKQDNIVTAMWFVEDHQVFPYWQLYAPLYDYFFVIQKEPFLQQLQNDKNIKAFYLPLAADPDFHKKQTLTSEEEKFYQADIAFMGAGYPNRRIAFRTLLKYDFKIWGSDWEGDELLARYVQKNGQRISPEESLKIYSATKINLNLHSSIHANKLVSHGDFVNPRTFELAAMGVFQLVDKRQLMPEHFTCSSLKNPREDAELAVFDSMEELQENILFYLKHPDLREKIAQNAQKRVTSEHTYIHRMKTLLQHIKENSQDFPKKTAEFQWDNAITPETREEITALLQELNLAPNVDFETVIQCLRKKNTVLTPTETALLFLSEWKKFYNA
jgi:Uncharacterized protein conserved in bacteria